MGFVPPFRQCKPDEENIVSMPRMKQLKLQLESKTEPKGKVLPNASDYKLWEQRGDCEGLHLGKDDLQHWHPVGTMGKRPRHKSYVRLRTQAGQPNEIDLPAQT